MKSTLFTRRNTAVGAAAMAVGLLIGNVGGLFAGDGIPADKATAAGAAVTEASPTTPLLTATFRTSKPTDLIMQVSAECAIQTSFTRNGKNTRQEASGKVRLWLTIDNDANIVPIESTSQPPQDPPAMGGDDDKVTFCERRETYDKTDGNSFCTEDAPPPSTVPSLPPAPSVSECETESWFQRVKTANSFNWVRLNAGSGVHTVKLWGEFTTTASSPTGETQSATALVGNRTLVIEPTKMANDAIMGPAGSS
jgi:hypothetical protein